jgi:hypothetical protein
MSRFILHPSRIERQIDRSDQFSHTRWTQNPAFKQRVSLTPNAGCQTGFLGVFQKIAKPAFAL